METLTAHLIEVLALIFFEFIVVWSFVWSDEFEILLDDCRVLADDISILAELQVVSFALQGAELVKMLSVFHWEKVFISCFAGCLHLEPFSICAISLVFLSVWKLSSFWMRLGLSMCRKRKRNRVQSKKRWSNIARRKHLERKLNNKGHLFLFLIVSNGYGVFGMDAQQFGQFMQGFSTLLQRQAAFIQGMAGTMGSGASSSTAEACGKQFVDPGTVLSRRTWTTIVYSVRLGSGHSLGAIVLTFPHIGASGRAAKTCKEPLRELQIKCVSQSLHERAQKCTHSFFNVGSMMETTQLWEVANSDTSISLSGRDEVNKKMQGANLRECSATIFSCREPRNSPESSREGSLYKAEGIER